MDQQHPAGALAPDRATLGRLAQHLRRVADEIDRAIARESKPTAPVIITPVHPLMVRAA